jgi:hypothetical protein
MRLRGYPVRASIFGRGGGLSGANACLNMHNEGKADIIDRIMRLELWWGIGELSGGLLEIHPQNRPD